MRIVLFYSIMRGGNTERAIKMRSRSRKGRARGGAAAGKVHCTSRERKGGASFFLSFSLFSSCAPRKRLERDQFLILFQSSTGHPGPSHAALCPVPLQASQGTLPRPLQAGHSLQPSSSEQNLSEPTVRAPLPRQNSQPQVPEPPQQSHGAEGVFLWSFFLFLFLEEQQERERKKEKGVEKKIKGKKKAPLD